MSKVDYSKLPLWLLKNFYPLIPFAIAVVSLFAENASIDTENMEMSQKWGIVKMVFFYITAASILSWIGIQGWKWWKTRKEINEAYDNHKANK